ncbi:MAG TPA: hypothetical protein VEV61_15065 [Streptosporangiaceae bacterium]|nr:hypothetical protein [Streptosporangiaceae bacterium]
MQWHWSYSRVVAIERYMIDLALQCRKVRTQKQLICLRQRNPRRIKILVRMHSEPGRMP